MKIKYRIILLIIGYCLQVFGALQKILHAPIADKVLIFSTWTIIAAWLIILFKLLTHPKFKEFINW